MVNAAESGNGGGGVRFRDLLRRQSACVFAALLFAGCATAEKQPPAPASATEPPRIAPVRLADFVVGAGDSLQITVYRHTDLALTTRVNTSGTIMFPLIGDVEAAGKGLFQLRDEIRDRLKRYVVNPQVSVSVTAVQSQKALVLGEVKVPGVFTLDTPLTLFEAVAKAGGVTTDAKTSNVLLIRRGKEKPEVVAVDLKHGLREGDSGADPVLVSGDVVYVPAATIANVSWFFGHVSKILSPFLTFEFGAALWPAAKAGLSGGGNDSPPSSISVPIQ
jgi:polysaccharide export outer membrane protein